MSKALSLGQSMSVENGQIWPSFVGSGKQAEGCEVRCPESYQQGQLAKLTTPSPGGQLAKQDTPDGTQPGPTVSQLQPATALSAGLDLATRQCTTVID